MFMNKNGKDKIKYRLFNTTTSKEKFIDPVDKVVNSMGQTSNLTKITPSGGNGIRSNSTSKNFKKPEKYSKGDTGGTSVPVKLMKKYQTEQIVRMSSDILPPRQQTSKYSISLKKNINSHNSQNFDGKKSNPFTIATDKSLSHRIVNGSGGSYNKDKFISMSNRNLGRDVREVNSLCSFDNTNNTFNNKPNYTTTEEHSVERVERLETLSNRFLIPKKENNFRIIKDKIPYKIKEKVNNIRIYTKPQMILVEDRSETKFEKELGGMRFKKGGNLRKTTHLAKSNIHEVLLKNFQENVKNNKGQGILTKLKIPTNKGIFTKFSFANMKDRCNTLDDILVEDNSNRNRKNANNYSLEEYLGNKAASFQESVDEERFGIINFQNSIIKDSVEAPILTILPTKKIGFENNHKDKHEEYKKKQETAYSVKLPDNFNFSEKEKELDKIFSSLEPIEPHEDENEYLNLNMNSHLQSNTSLAGSEKNESGVLTYDEVKDIIVHYSFRDIDIKDRNLFPKNVYENFNTKRKKNCMNFFFNNQTESANLPDGNKSYSTKDSSSNKKNFISVIKLAEI